MEDEDTDHSRTTSQGSGLLVLRAETRVNRDACPAYGKIWTNCGRKSPVASKWKVRTNKKSLHNLDDMDMTNELFQAGTAHLDESKLITL